MKSKKSICFLLLLVASLFLLSCGGDETNGKTDEAELASIAEELALPEDAGETTDMQLFATIDLYGNVVTNEVFKDYSYTLIYVWGTYCNPCIKSLPSMEELYQTYKDKGVNMMGMLVDVQNQDLTVIPEQVVFAREILDSTEVTFANLLIPENLLYSVIGGIRATPTTLLVDSEGAIQGVYEGGRTVEMWKEILDEKLDN